MSSNGWKLIAWTTSFLVLLTSAAHADLVGDEVSVRIRVPNINAFDQTQTATVAPVPGDTSDVLVFSPSSGIQITVDPTPNGFYLTHTGTEGVNLGPGVAFTFSDLDFSPPAQVTNVSYGHDWAFINATTSWTADSASIEFTGNSAFAAGNFMSVNLQTGPLPPAPTPSVTAPGAIALMLGMLSVGGLLMRRSRSAV